MPNKMLIDASHPEETRVVVVRGNRIEEFDFESENKKQLKGNIYLARVTRVEPSLQAAFVEYGGNRHGFLAFSEIHPDYYQIPVADRQALLDAEAEDALADEEDDDDVEERRNRSNRRRRGRSRGRASDAHGASSNGDNDETAADVDSSESADENGDENGDEGDNSVTMSEAVATDVISEEVSEAARGDDATRDNEMKDGAEKDASSGEDTAAAADATDQVQAENQADQEHANDDHDEEHHDESSDDDNHDDDNHGDDNDEVVSVGAGDALDEVQPRRRTPRKQYKIQEVIKRRQILLVQVVKEERGNKGAALTTYLSLAGRYSVLMPNTARGGGISRKITNAADRKRLKDVVKDLGVPQGMGVILRTAGESRTKAEIKRDYEYLMRLWDNVRELTLQSTAPALVYEEGSLIKRSVRDLYNKDINEILVAGEEGYREAKDFMRMLMPSHAKVVQPYRDTVPIFARNGIEGQLDRMVQPQVTLKSGGYIIINQTEALVAIDVNSGRSTKEHSIEDTALQTNLEAAEEVARQLRLRDLAGLIVIDFIDMEENRNNRAVEKRLKECLKNDRARIQVGRISHFGLLEMSRQRLRASVLESTMQICTHCGGTGHVRSESSVALLVIRAIEEFLLKDSRHHITVRMPVSTAIYVLNHKRANLNDLESRFGLTITIEADDSVHSQHYVIAKGAQVERPAGFVPVAPQINYAVEEDDDDIIDVPDEADESEEATTAPKSADNGNGEAAEDGQNKRRRRRRRRGGRGRDASQTPDAAEAATDTGPAAGDEDQEPEEEAAVASDGDHAENGEADEHPKKRRRGKRGGRRIRREEADGDVSVAENSEMAVEPIAVDQAETALVETATVDTATLETSGSSVDEAAQAAIESSAAPESVAEPAIPEAVESGAVAEAAPDAEPEAAATPETEAKPAPKKRAPRRTTKKAKEAEAEQMPVEPEVTDAVEALDAKPIQETPKPKRAPRRRAAAKPVANDAASETSEDASKASASVESQPKAEEPVKANKAVAKTPTPPEPAPLAVAQMVSSEETAPVAEGADAGAAATEIDATEPVVTSNGSIAAEEESKPRKAGWWQRRGFF